MIRPPLTVLTCLLASACATSPENHSSPTERHDFVAAALDANIPEHPVQIVETAIPLPLPGQLKPLDPSPAATSLPPAEIIAKGTHAARLEPTADGYLNAIHVYPYTEGALYCLYASPGQVSDIALQPGETLVSVSAGDTVRWVVGDTSSGSGDDTRTHILVKPVASGLTTNLMIATDRRTYHLELTSLETSYMAALSWRYPADELAILTSRNQIARSRQAESISPNLNLSDLNFDYRIEGDRPDWRPVRVFDDGRRVFIQMPADLAMTEAPPLFVLGRKGNAELINYRIRGSYYIVDHLFEAAELRLGTAPQTVVRLRRGKAPAGFAALFGDRK